MQIPTGISVTNCNHKHGLKLTCRHVHGRLHCFILTEACSCTMELAYFSGKIAKNRLVCKNAVALAYYGSCTLLVMGSYVRRIVSPTPSPDYFTLIQCFLSISICPKLIVIQIYYPKSLQRTTCVKFANRKYGNEGCKSN